MPIGHLLLDRFACVPWTKLEYAQHSPERFYDEFPRTVCNRMGVRLRVVARAPRSAQARQPHRVAGRSGERRGLPPLYLLNRKRVQEGHNDFGPDRALPEALELPDAVPPWLGQPGVRRRVVAPVGLLPGADQPAAGSRTHAADGRSESHRRCLQQGGLGSPHVSALLEKGGSGRRNDAPHPIPRVGHHRADHQPPSPSTGPSRADASHLGRKRRVPGARDRVPHRRRCAPRGSSAPARSNRRNR